jgi:hypothetical protein
LQGSRAYKIILILQEKWVTKKWAKDIFLCAKRKMPLHFIYFE